MKRKRPSGSAASPMGAALLKLRPAPKNLAVSAGILGRATAVRTRWLDAFNNSRTVQRHWHAREQQVRPNPVRGALIG